MTHEINSVMDNAWQLVRTFPFTVSIHSQMLEAFQGSEQTGREPLIVNNVCGVLTPRRTLTGSMKPFFIPEIWYLQDASGVRMVPMQVTTVCNPCHVIARHLGMHNGDCHTHHSYGVYRVTSRLQISQGCCAMCLLVDVRKPSHEHSMQAPTSVHRACCFHACSGKQGRGNVRHPT